MNEKRRPTWCPECRNGKPCPFAGTRAACPPRGGGAWSFHDEPPNPQGDVAARQRSDLDELPPPRK